MSLPTLSPEDFAALVKSLDLPVAPDEMDELRQAYGIILRVRQRLQSMATAALEPAHTFRPLTEKDVHGPGDGG